MRDMQHWRPRSITPEMLDKIRAAHRDDPVRVSLAIVNRTVWYLRPLGTPRSPMVIALVHDLQELADQHEVADVEFVLNVDDYPFVSRAGRGAADSPPRARAHPGAGERAKAPRFRRTSLSRPSRSASA